MTPSFSKLQQVGKREPKESKPIKKVSEKQAKDLKKRARIKKKLGKNASVCQECGEVADFRGLELHHSKPLARGGKTVESNLRLLCSRCHSEAHHIIEK